MSIKMAWITPRGWFINHNFHMVRLNLGNGMLEGYSLSKKWEPYIGWDDYLEKEKIESIARLSEKAVLFKCQICDEHFRLDQLIVTGDPPHYQFYCTKCNGKINQIAREIQTKKNLEEDVI
jgi:hypothetical protein